MKQPKFKLFQSDKDDQWYFSLIAPNGETIAQSEGYISKQNALKGINSVKENATTAKVFEITEITIDYNFEKD